MTALRQLSGKELLRIFSSFGFQVVSFRGSHAKLSRVLSSGERQILVVPMHKTVAAGTLRAIYRQALRFVPEQDLKAWFFTTSA